MLLRTHSINMHRVRRSKLFVIDLYIIHDTHVVIPAQAGIQQDKKAFRLNPLDSRLRGNDAAILLFSKFHFG